MTETVSTNFDGTTEDRRPLWQAIVDSCCNGDLVSGQEIGAWQSVAITAASDLPQCAVCESLYKQVLNQIFGIGDELVSGLGDSRQPVAETLFSVGRAGILGIAVDYGLYLPFCLRETCIALHDVDLIRAADGVLALAAIRNKAASAMSFVEQRFLRQALTYLSVAIVLYPNDSLRRLLEASHRLCHP